MDGGVALGTRGSMVIVFAAVVGIRFLTAGVGDSVFAVFRRIEAPKAPPAPIATRPKTMNNILLFTCTPCRIHIRRMNGLSVNGPAIHGLKISSLP